MKPELYYGVDLGGTKTKAVLCDDKLSVLCEKTIPTDMTSVDTIMAGIFHVLDVVGAGVSRQAIRAIGVATPGQIDRVQGIAIQAPSMGWHDVPIGQILGERYETHAYLENDINAAALGEFFAQEDPQANAVYVNVGTGIGAGAIVGGRLYLGANGFAGEFGHLTVEPTGPWCKCGNRGCLEAIASGPAIGERATQWARASYSSAMREEALRRELTAKDVSAFALAGDELARKLLEETGTYLGRAVADMVNLLDPGTVIFGGSVILNSPFIWEAMEQEARMRLMPIVAAGTRLVKARLGSDSGGVGAAALARDRAEHSEARR